MGSNYVELSAKVTTLGEVKCKSLKIIANFLLLMAILQDWDLNSNLARFFSCIQILQDILQDS